MFWAMVFMMLVWLAHQAIQASSNRRTVNQLGFIALAAGGLWLLRRVLARRRRLARQGD